MKNENAAPSYFSTSQAAKILGLSVGTVQRMVETGVFKAFVTQGGHRRILSASLTQFCQAQGFASPQVQPSTPMVCILHASDQMTRTLSQLSQWQDVKVITQPLDLMGLQRHISALFIDARIAWVHGSPMHLQDTSARDAHIVIYNSAQLPPASALHAANHVSLFKGDISTDLIFGYFLGCNRDHACSPPRPHASAKPPTPSGHKAQDRSLPCLLPKPHSDTGKLAAP